VRNNFDLTPGGIIKALDLQKPIYHKTAVQGHFGLNEYSWEKPKTLKFWRTALTWREAENRAVTTERDEATGRDELESDQRGSTYRTSRAQYALKVVLF